MQIGQNLQNCLRSHERGIRLNGGQRVGLSIEAVDILGEGSLHCDLCGRRISPELMRLAVRGSLKSFFGVARRRDRGLGFGLFGH